MESGKIKKLTASSFIGTRYRYFVRRASEGVCEKAKKKERRDTRTDLFALQKKLPSMCFLVYFFFCARVINFEGIGRRIPRSNVCLFFLVVFIVVVIVPCQTAPFIVLT